MASPALKTTLELNEGDIAPDFSLPGDGDSTIALADYKGKKNVVIYFYPKDDTPGCTIEAKDFRDAMADFEKADTVIIGISKDAVSKHNTFKEKYCLPFALASDAASDVCERYGQWVEKSMYGKKYMGINRATFLVAKDGTIAKLWPKVKIEGHAQEVLAAAKAL
ncbi:MAG: thioredoxin-dependent thiol peroxidase [Alphaproteobacteria bacterium]|nr:thioredoxin-dependent thiol peroxidase [Alphaproteobacteria bacterium]